MLVLQPVLFCNLDHELTFRLVSAVIGLLSLGTVTADFLYNLNRYEGGLMTLFCEYFKNIRKYIVSSLC